LSISLASFLYGTPRESKNMACLHLCQDVWEHILESDVFDRFISSRISPALILLDKVARCWRRLVDQNILLVKSGNVQQLLRGCAMDEMAFVKLLAFSKADGMDPFVLACTQELAEHYYSFLEIYFITHS